MPPEETALYRAQVVSSIDDLVNNIELIVSNIDFYIDAMTHEEFGVHGQTLRHFQSKLKRLEIEANTIYRRLE